MRQDYFGSQPPGLPSRVTQRTRLVRWHLAWPVALVAIAMAVGVSVAAGDPNWGGTEPEDISNSPTNRAWQPVVAAGPPAQVVVVWSDQESPEAPRNVYTRRSDDNGRTWSAPEVISGTAKESALPDVLVTGSQAFVAWVDQNTVGGQNVAIYEAEVGAGGARRVPIPVPLSSTQPRLAAGSDRLHVAFNAGANILHAARPLAATEWPTATRAYTSAAAPGPWFPALAVGPDEETLHMVWQEIDTEWTGEWTQEWTIMYGRGEEDGGEVSWSPPLTLSTGSTELVYPAIVADSVGNLHVVWAEVIGAGDLQDQAQYIRYSRYDVASSEWISSAKRIDDTGVRVNRDNPTYTAPSLALFERDSQVEVCVAWHGFREGGFAEEVLLSCSRDQGRSWSTPQNVSRSTDAVEGISIMPSIAFDPSGQLQSVWQEHNASMGDSVIFDYQVYHARALGNKVFLPVVARN